MKRILLLFTIASLVMFSSALTYGQTEIVLDNVTGLLGVDTVHAGSSVKFTFRLTYTPGDGSTINGSTNGFQVWMANGGTRTPITYDTVSVGWSSMYDGGFFFSPHGVDGMGADTIGFAGFALFAPGIQ